MTGLPPATALLRAAEAGDTGPVASVALTYDARLLRRKRLFTTDGTPVLVDLPQTVSLDAGDRLVLEDGTQVEVLAAEEALLEIRATAADLPRLAWHIGNRHAPACIEADPPRILIQRDPVIRRMLEGLGASVTEVTEPFTPEGGAYGHGRTMGHSHGDHDHHHAHSHDH
ncbi:urease accessory protein UreE [Histidinibacterium aquaticum]|uniref:Urease accessory protein UreE n=1 Tax=Histidinibacterium aquaticum TaxID=2613962 RepID=A0A5J5GJ72_9RHOB|nr:urease accessory protein UreE [Histidinibacterium aquaticum]KAA9008195.1 urease accessory protein UreE [Histidinibacterium aquaticum]